LLTQHVEDVEIVKGLQHTLPRGGRNDVAHYPVVVQHRDGLRLGRNEGCTGIFLEVADAYDQVGVHSLENLVHFKLHI